MSLLTRKILPPFFGIATIGWIIGGTIWFDNQLSKKNANVFSNLSAANSSVIAQSGEFPRNICFNSGSAIPIFYDQLAIKKTVDFLLDNNNQSLVLTGLSDVLEKNNAGLDLGFARAEAVKNTLTKLGAPNNSLEVLSEKKAHLLDANNQICDAVKMRFVDNNDSRFQALNLFFKTNKFRFKETAELQSYFSDLKVFLEKNPQTKLKIAAHSSDTEGGKISEKRLVFIVDLLKNKGFNIHQFNFEDNKTKAASNTTANVQDFANQRIEIRILTP